METMRKSLSSFFFISDLYHLKGSNDETDRVPDSVIFFYPPNEELKQEKLVDCGHLIGLSLYFLYDTLNSSITEFYYKKTIVTCSNYGRHCAFLVLNRDRFSSDEARLHLHRILDVFHLLFGTLNHIHNTHPDTTTISRYLQEKLTPIVDYVFNATRSLPSLFSAVKYLPATVSIQLMTMDAKHFLQHLQAKSEIQHGMITYDNRVLHSTFDTNMTYFLQLILKILPKLPDDYIREHADTNLSLKSGVRLLNAYFPLALSTVAFSEPPSPMPMDQTNTLATMLTRPSNSIRIQSSFRHPREDDLSSNENDWMSPSPAVGSSNLLAKNLLSSPVLSSEETGFETDRAESAPSSSRPSSFIETRSLPQELQRKDSYVAKTFPSLSTSNTRQDSDSSDNDHHDCLMNSDTINLTEIKNDEEESGYDDVPMCLPVSTFNRSSTFRPRSHTLTNATHSSPKIQRDFKDMPDHNDETERNLSILYLQKNSRMTALYLLRTQNPSEQYLNDLWLVTTEKLSQWDRDIYMTCNLEEIERSNNRLKFRYLDDTHCLDFLPGVQNNRLQRPTISSDVVGLAFHARTKLSAESDRRMIGFSRANHVISVDRRPQTRTNFVYQQLPRS